MAETDSPEFQKALAPDSLPDTPTGGGAVRKSRSMTAGMRFILVIFAAMLLLLGYIMLQGGNEDPAAVSSVDRPPLMDTTVAGQVQANNPRYAEAVRAYQEEQAQQALDEGRSYIPAPEAILVPDSDDTDRLDVTTRTEPVQPAPQPRRVETTRVAASPAPVPEVRPRPVQVENPRPIAPDQGGNGGNGEEQVNPYLQAMTTQMQMISGAMAPSKMASEDYARDGQEADMAMAEREAQIQSSLPRPPAGADGAPVPAGDPGLPSAPAGDELPRGEIIIQAGDILYAQVLADTVSDFVTPVVAEITVGKHKGARLVGAFEMDKRTDRMQVGFTQMTWPDGTARKISALAVDGDTGETAVRSGIERRYFQRYAPIFAATFLNGLAQGASEPDKVIISNPDGGQSAVEEPRTAEESAWKGVSEATGVITDDIRERMPDGPKVKLSRGHPIGVMFAQDLREDEAE